MRILIVDDDHATRLCLVKVLTPAGKVDNACNGQEALEAFERALTEGRPYSLVCMDICMPGLDGQQALKGLRALEASHAVPAGKEVKVVMVSSCDDTGNVCEAYFHGQADGFVKKPLRMDDFRNELRRVGFLLP